MKKLAAIIWEYFIPLLFLLIALDTLLGDPDQRILKSIPIVPGQYQRELAALFAVVAVVLGLIVYRHKKNQDHGQS
jgi:hypothetical protein